MKDELFDSFIFEFISFNFNKLLQPFDNFSNCTILIFQIVKFFFFNVWNSGGQNLKRCKM